jgi:hypothetical protein
MVKNMLAPFRKQDSHPIPAKAGPGDFLALEQAPADMAFAVNTPEAS